MKLLVFIALAMTISMSSTAPAENGKHLFILSGQSNMAHLDPNESFTPAVEAEFGKDNVIVVKDAQSGQPIRRWYKKWRRAEGDELKATGDLYDRLMAKVDSATSSEKIKTVTFVWMQGERDARESLGEVYAKSLRGLIAQLSADLHRPDLNVVIGRLSDFDMNNAKYPHWTMVREAQVAVAESNPRWAWVDTDDLNDKRDKQSGELFNDLHYTKKGYKLLGRRFAEKAMTLEKNNAESSVEAGE